jgi:hypothetical protein
MARNVLAGTSPVPGPHLFGCGQTLPVARSEELPAVPILGSALGSRLPGAALDELVTAE